MRHRAFDGHFEPGINETAQGNVAHADLIAGQVRLGGQGLIGHRQQRAHSLIAGVDGGPVLLVCRGAQDAPEHRAERTGKTRGGPVHPLVGVGAGLQVGRVPARRPLGAQVTDDGIGFPQHEAIIFNHRHPAIGVHRAVFRRVDHTKAPPASMAS
jgi:hypothetical protein